MLSRSSLYLKIEVSNNAMYLAQDLQKSLTVQCYLHKCTMLLEVPNNPMLLVEIPNSVIVHISLNNTTDDCRICNCVPYKSSSDNSYCHFCYSNWGYHSSIFRLC